MQKGSIELGNKVRKKSRQETNIRFHMVRSKKEGEKVYKIKSKETQWKRV